MALRLEVLSDHRKILGENASIVFGVGGGSFGRAADNDWVLLDPQRYLSGHHGRIHFRQGAWYLEDLSTNGTFVNGGPLPVSRTGPHALQDGDLLRFGEYEVRATIDALENAGAATGATSSVIARSPTGTSVERVMPARVGGGGDDLGASLNFEALIHTDGLSEVPPTDTGGRSDFANARLQRLRSAARARLEGKAPVPQELRGTLQAFCRGAGIDPQRLPADADLRLLHVAGQLLREILLGVQDLARTRAEFRNSYLVDETNDHHEGPSLSRLGADEYLLKLLEGHDKRELDALLVVREELKSGARHQTALAQALPQAFSAFIAHLAPEEIQSRFDNAGARASAPSPWELYAEIFRNLTQLTGGTLPHLYTEALAQAYLALLRRPDE
jgi:predicted component of type VI protein secretion system